MGGSGSGNWYRWNAKATEENFWRLPANSLKKYTHIQKGQWSSGTWQWSRNGEVCSWIRYELNTCGESSWMRVHYTNKGTGKDYDYKIYLTTTRPHYGGIRWWFHCPAQGCGRRVAVLYLAHIFACRRCCDFTYVSQNEAPHFRLLSKAQKIHQELGGDGVVDEPLTKPKGMHWKTYRRKVEMMQAAHSVSLMEAARRFGIEI